VRRLSFKTQFKIEFLGPLNGPRKSLKKPLVFTVIPLLVQYALYYRGPVPEVQYVLYYRRKLEYLKKPCGVW
jgi:hypothetical protein